MKKIYHLSTCNTNQRIIKELGLKDRNDIEMQDIKFDKMTLEQVDHMKSLAGSYEALFSRRSMKFRSMGLADKTLTEDDYRQLIIDEYTFLKRPVIVIDDKIFIGSAKAQVQGAAEAIG
ncbi:arsenate reductase family protein [Sanyastnella coralliicola]|uniref:arsenate reductase family protein n=1 Tax=Sanyastnella coralliicola TaxID=3069118 RepID=UPI0027BAC9BB|nr:ArsC/Spx/MgsR family protein [Longitalea sp. SCSIO 12813]